MTILKRDELLDSAFEGASLSGPDGSSAGIILDQRAASVETIAAHHETQQ